MRWKKFTQQIHLDKLFPNYSFYKKKGISEETQKKFQVGLAGVGKMYRRMVFPIYNEHQQIIGFSGRKVDDNNNYPKWKHLGKRNSWVYPAFNSSTNVLEEITLKKRSNFSRKYWRCVGSLRTKH